MWRSNTCNKVTLVTVFQNLRYFKNKNKIDFLKILNDTSRLYCFSQYSNGYFNYYSVNEQMDLVTKNTMELQVSEVCESIAMC